MNRDLIKFFAALALLTSLFVIAQDEANGLVFYTSHTAHERLGMIDLSSGMGTDIGSYAHPEVVINRTGWAGANGTIYDGEFYMIVNKRLPAEAHPSEAQSHLVKVEMSSGETEVLGPLIHLNLMALEIDACGTMYASGFTLSNQLGEWFGDTNLYRVDRDDASLTLVGKTGVEKIMDLAFDPEGTLWATVGNVLYTLDTASGRPTEVVHITGVEEDRDEIMGIAFTSDGTLYGTTPFSDGVYTINPATGEVVQIGRHGFTVVHGGDIPLSASSYDCDE